MKIQINVIGGSMEDLIVLRNIFNSYDISVDYVLPKPEKNEMGADFLPALLLLLPEVTQFVKAVLPALNVYIESRKPSGTKHEIELVNGEKKIHVIKENGKTIDMDEIVEFCNRTKFFEG